MPSVSCVLQCGELCNNAPDAITSPCVLQCDELCNNATDAITSESWDNIKEKALLWSGLDNGPSGLCVPKSCKLTLWNTKKLQQAKAGIMKREAEKCQRQSPL